MIYGLSSLFSYLLLGYNVVSNYTPLGLLGALLRCISGYFYWFFGHLFGVEQFYNSLGENVSYAWNFNEWCVKSGVPPFEIFLPVLLGFIYLSEKQTSSTGTRRSNHYITFRGSCRKYRRVFVFLNK